MPPYATRPDAKGHQVPAYVNCQPRITMADIQRHGSYEAARKARKEM